MSNTALKYNKKYPLPTTTIPSLPTCTPPPHIKEINVISTQGRSFLCQAGCEDPLSLPQPPQKRMLSEKEYDEKLKIVCLWSFSQASCYTAVWRQRITWSGRERGLNSAEEEVAKGVLDDKVEVTNFSISKSSEHRNVVQETFNLSHNWSEWLQHWTWLKRRQRQRQRLSRKRRKWNIVHHSIKIT